MNKKYTIDAIKDLKSKINELGDNSYKYYTPNSFKCDDSLKLVTEDINFGNFDNNLVEKMIEQLNKNNEFEAGRILFENLKLTPLQASDIGFWTYHNHHTFYKYIMARWPDLMKQNENKMSSYVLNHWIQSSSSQSDLIDYPISGLWWSFYLTVREENNYELTKIFFKNATMRTKRLGSSRFAKHKPAIIGILEYIDETKLYDKSIEESIRSIVSYVNILGGIRPLTYFDKDWFKGKLYNRFPEFNA